MPEEFVSSRHDYDVHYTGVWFQRANGSSNLALRGKVFWTDRSKYKMPHQGKQECERRKRRGW